MRPGPAQGVRRSAARCPGVARHLVLLLSALGRASSTLVVRSGGTGSPQALEPPAPPAGSVASRTQSDVEDEDGTPFLGRGEAHPGKHYVQHSPIIAKAEATTQAPLSNATTTSPATKSSAQVEEEQLGVKKNSSADTAKLGVALAFNGFVASAILLVFSCIWRRYPLMYSHPSAGREAPVQPLDTFTGWFWAGLSVTVDEATDAAGLDVAMFIEFCNFGMRATATIGLPLCAVMCPIYCYFGSAESTDVLTRYGMSNISQEESTVYGLVALVVWAVVVGVQHMIWSAQEKFIPRRIAWLKAMPEPRATTLLVTDIPREFCSDAKLREYYEKLFPGAVLQVYVAKKTGELIDRVEELKLAEQCLHQANHEWEKSDRSPDKRPQIMDPLNNQPIDKIEFYWKAKEEAEAKVAAERRRVQHAMDTSDPVLFASEGFVTFKTRRDAEIARQLQLEHEGQSFQMTYAPDPGDVRYADLLLDSQQRRILTAVGYGCIVLSFFAFLPVVTALASITNLQTLESIPFIKWLLDKLPVLVSLVEGVLASLALTVVMSFLPSLFHAIFLQFFSLKAEAWSQAYLQNWYYIFLVVFVLLITAVGTSLWASIKEIAEHPVSLFPKLAGSLPNTAHFYMDFTVLQCTSETMQLLRLVPLLKFLSLRVVCDEERARELAEPEDQDYYGIGSRSARTTLVLVTGLIFSTVVPLILPLTFLFFFIARFAYGYLMVFAETKKADLGGVFWCQALRHVQDSMLIYVVMMSGIFYSRAATWYPFLIAVSSVGYLLHTRMSFERNLLWESLPFSRAIEVKSESEGTKSQGAYVQRELADSVLAHKSSTSPLSAGLA